MKIKPLLGGFKGAGGIMNAIGDVKNTIENNKKNKELDIERKLLDTDVKLRLLNDRYKLLLQKELLIARSNKSRGKKNSANYAKIGTAYYALNAVKGAQERLQNITSARELYSCMTDLSGVLGAINDLGGQTGKVDTKKLSRQIAKMGQSEGGATANMIKTLETLNGIDAESLLGLDNFSVDSLVSQELIEKLINGDQDLEEAVTDREGILESTDDLLKMLEGLSGGEGNAVNPAEIQQQTDISEITEADIDAATQSIADLIAQL